MTSHDLQQPEAMVQNCERQLCQSAEHSNSGSDEESLFAAPDAQRVRWFSNRRSAACFIAAGVFFCLCSMFTYAVPSSGRNDAATQNRDADAKRPSQDSAVALFQSNSVQEAVGNLAVHISELSASPRGLKSALNGSSNAHGVVRSSFSESQVRQLKTKAGFAFRKVLNRFFSVHPEALEVLSTIQLSSEEAVDVVAMLRALTDTRLLSVSHAAATACAKELTGLAACMRRQFAADQPKLLELRRELVPRRLRNHMSKFPMLQQKLVQQHTLHASGNVVGWHAEVDVKMRSLQEFETPVSGPPPDPFGTILGQVFGIGGPILAGAVGLLFTSLMGLMPGTGGTCVNQVAAYSIYGVEGAEVLANCLLNIGFEQNINNVASCVSSALFFGLDAIFVFGGGRKVADAQRRTNCNPYHLWPELEGVCGNCIGRIPSPNKTLSCDAACNSFGHMAEFAAVPVPRTCFPQFRYATREVLPSTSIVCQCVLRLGAGVQSLGNSLPSQPTQAIVLPDIIVNRRLSTVPAAPVGQQCLHETPYIIQVTTSSQPEARSSALPRFQLKVRGELLGGTNGFEFFQKSAAPGMAINRSLILLDRPDELILLAHGSDSYRYRQIVLIHGSEMTEIVSSTTMGHSDQTSLASSRQHFAIPSRGNFRDAISTATHVGPFTTVEIVTASRDQAGTQGSLMVNASLIKGSQSLTFPILISGQSVKAGECISVSIPAVSFEAERLELTGFSVGGAFNMWGYSRIAVITNRGTSLALNTLNGEALGKNKFWIGAGTSQVRSFQTFNVNSWAPNALGSEPLVQAVDVRPQASRRLQTSSINTTTPSTIQCFPYTNWPPIILGEVCGSCEAVVPANTFGRRCDNFCQSFGHQCLQAAQSNGTCTPKVLMPCNVPVPGNNDDMLCTCFNSTAPPTNIAPNCASYNEWPAINRDVCAQCQARVPIGIPTSPQLGSSCTSFCANFGHQCKAAATLGNSPCSVRSNVNCSDEVPATEILCTCERS